MRSSSESPLQKEAVPQTKAKICKMSIPYHKWAHYIPNRLPNEANFTELALRYLICTPHFILSLMHMPKNFVFNLKIISTLSRSSKYLLFPLDLMAMGIKSNSDE